MKHKMTYEILINSVSEIFNNDLIYKDKLTLTYKLDVDNHKKLSEHFYYKMNLNNDGENYEYSEEFEVEIGGIMIKFIIDEN